MTDFIEEENKGVLNKLLTIYEKVMVLKLFVDSNDDKLKNMYSTAAYRHNNKLLDNPQHIDAGFDLYAPGNEEFDGALHFFGAGWENTSPVNKLDYKVSCSARMFTDRGKSFNTGYYMYPRSSLSKTKLRLANSTGIIDAGYSGHLIGMFDVVNLEDNDNYIDADYLGVKYDRYLQICAPGLVPIIIEIVKDAKELGDETERGAGGFGSTGR